LLRCALLQLPADRAGAGEGDRLDALVLDEDVADLGGRAGDDAEPARREARFLLELGEQQRRERRLARRLQHHRAAGRERGRKLVRDEVEREVERRDRADDPDRLAQGECELALAGPRRGRRPLLSRASEPRTSRRSRPTRRRRRACVPERLWPRRKSRRLVRMGLDIRYAKSGAVSIAYQVVGGGEVDLLYVPDYVSNLVYGWESVHWRG